MPGFIKGADGSITLWTAEQFQVAICGGMTIGLWAEYHQSPDKTLEPLSIQLALTPEQALLLARALETAAHQAMKPPDSTNVAN
jgi:hypothetical protein